MDSDGDRAVTVLVVEDDRGVRESLEVVMRVQGYNVIGVETGEAALSYLRREGADDIDLVVLDINLPGIDGLETCRQIRHLGSELPVLMLTARHEVADRVRGLDAGADGYLPKPFALDELLARIRALLRAFDLDVGRQGDGILSIDDLTLDPRTRQVERGGREIDLTRIEFELLTYLVANQDRVLTRDDLMLEIWGYEEDVSSNTLEVFISGLRKKLEANGASRLIHTKRGVGYVVRQQR